MTVFSFSVGSREIPLATTIEAVTDYTTENTDHLLVRHLRSPRTLLGLLVGSCLGVAGAVMQALTRNPLADPGILGVNAGAAVAISIAIAFLGVTSVMGYMWFGMLGAASAGGAVYLLGGLRRGTNPVRVVLSGTALSVVLMALTQIVILNSEEVVFDRFRHWTVGSLQGRGFEVLGPVAILAAVGLLLAFGLTRALDGAALGEDLSRALGANPLRVWTLAATSVIILAGAATAAAGPVTFVGLAAPHVARLVTGPDHRWVLPWSMLLSAIMMVAADALGRVIVHPGEVAVGIVVALLGSPVFIALVRQRRLVQL